MSTTAQEARSLEAAQEFLLKLSSGEYKVGSIKKLRQDARDVMRHYPLDPGNRWVGRGSCDNR